MPDDGKEVVGLAGASASVLGSSSALHYPPKILAALHAVMSKCGYVQKQGENKFHGYRYAGEGNLLEVLRPAMVDAGLLLIPSGETLSPIDAHGNVFVTVHYTLAHKDGDVWPEKISVFGAGNDKNKAGGVGDKGLYKALTGANKYLLFKLFQIETGDDPEKDSEADKAPAPPAEAPPRKSNPGISKARTWASEELRDLNSSEDGPDLMQHVEGLRAHYVRICREYPELWNGPDGSGLRGEAYKVATLYQVGPEMKKWLLAIEADAKSTDVTMAG